jgi:hypothetical protein
MYYVLIKSRSFPLIDIWFFAAQVGIYVALVKKHPIICAIRVHILRARGVYKMLILFVSEEIKVCVEYARKL